MKNVRARVRVVLTCGPYPTNPLQEAADTGLADIKDVIRDFLGQANYKSPGSQCDVELRTKLATELARWPADISPVVVSKVLDDSCIHTETTYGHTTPEHRFYIALYTACLMYVDDLGERDLFGVVRSVKLRARRSTPYDAR